jgi:hypothetical protein
VKLRKKWTRCLRVRERKSWINLKFFFVFLHFSRMLLWVDEKAFVGREEKLICSKRIGDLFVLLPKWCANIIWKLIFEQIGSFCSRKTHTFRSSEKNII